MIARASVSQGLWWELQTARAVVPPERFLLLVPADRRDYAEFRERSASLFPHPLPDIRERTRLLSGARTIIEFDGDWSPRVLPVVRSFVRTPFSAPYLARLKLTLAPVFDRLRVPYSPPPIALARMAALGVSLVVFVLLASISIALRLESGFRSYDAAYAPSYGPAPGVPIDIDTPSGVQGRSAFDDAAARFGPRLLEMSEFQNRATSLHSPSEAHALGRELTLRGLGRLSNERLLDHVVLMGRVLELADTHTCAATATGRSDADFVPAIRQLSASETERWFELAFEAAVAELRKVPTIDAPDQAQVESAFVAVTSRLSAADADLLIAVMTEPQEASDDDACTASRLLYSTLVDLPEPHRSVLARVLVIVE
ncbi:MAG TPA: hypothetical protein VMM18_17295 [Gemmatimonadaceae bacterium]|nr:hypothetical protein [Gemmatimonadaceae bacterium]